MQPAWTEPYGFEAGMALGLSKGFRNVGNDF